MANIRIPRGDGMGKTRSEHEENLRKEWGSTMSDEQLDKMKFMERKVKKKNGLEKNYLRLTDIDLIK